MTELTVLNHYALRDTPAAFSDAIAALARRVKEEGHPGVLSYKFYVCAETASARAIIRYANADAWIGHHDIAMPWPEMARLHAVAQLSDVTFLGDVPDVITDWLSGSALTARIVTGFAPAAGFDRREPGVTSG